jgi:signal transduction histidine kinase
VIQRLRNWASRHPTAVDAALAAAIGAVAAPDVADRGGDPLLAFALFAGLVAPLAWRRRAPASVFAAIALVAFVQWVVAEPHAGDVTLLVAFYTVAAHEQRRWLAAAAAAVLALGSVLTVASADGDQLVSLASLAAMVVAAGALGIYARTRRDYLDSLVKRATADERARIAREMHDVVAHSLSVMIALADGAELTADPAEARAAMRQTATAGRQALAEMRGVLGLLRVDAAPAELGPQPGLAQLEELLDQVRAAGVAAGLRLSGDPVPLSAGEELTVYRLVQEALTNTLRHARAASTAEVRLHYAGRTLEVAVTDDGAAPAAAEAGGHGLRGMSERAALHGAAVEAGPRPGGGWQVLTRLPLAGQ